MLKDFVSLCPEDTVIQNGANSAVGQLVIQLCKAWCIKTVNIVRNRPDIDCLKVSLNIIFDYYYLPNVNICLINKI